MDVATYVNRFPEDSRDVVVEQIMKGRVLKQAMSTIAGKAILNSAIDDIHKGLVAIINLCISEKKLDKEDLGLKIEQYAHNIQVTYRLMQQWAQMIIDNDRHEEAMKKK